MTISNANPQIDQGSSVEFMPDCSVGGRISCCAGQIPSIAPSTFRCLKFSVSSLALGSVIAISLMGGGSIRSDLHED